MTLEEMERELALEYITPELRSGAPLDVTRGHASDLLSDVLASAPGGGILVTVQAHMNVIAVCVHAGLPAVIFASGRAPEDAVRQRAVKEGVHLFVSKQSAFDVSGQLYAFGLRGHDV
jgi:hypothetical protein